MPMYKLDPKSLPVYQEKDKITKALETNQVIVIESPTGSGKTTQLPLILHEAGYSKKGVIGVTQPRRIATLSVCDYIAQQLETKIPGPVGYKMRFNDMTNSETYIKIMTDGILLQELKADRTLSRYSCIVVDEAHERSLNIDFILGLLKTILEVRADFKVIISSATINTSIFSEYFGECPVVHIDSIIYPVGIIYDPLQRDNPDMLQDKRGGRRDSGRFSKEVRYDRNRIDAVVEKTCSIVDRILSEKRDGDVLIFLSGEKQIKECITILNSSQYRKKMVILPLYGRLSKEEQERVFILTPSGKTKIVIATNIAETSVTINGIATVIDSGNAKINTYNPKSYTSSLLETTISKASCNQRKGRAGRTMPGTCYRLYTKSDYESRPLFTKEEIYRTDLSEVVMRMAEIGIRDFESFNFISSPGKQGMAGAVETLRLLDVLNKDNSLTKIGEIMVNFPLLPRLSRMIVEAIINYPDVVDETILAATFLSTSNPYLLPQGEELEARKAHHSFRSPDGDFISYINIFNSYMEAEDKSAFCKKNYLDIIIIAELANIKNQLDEIVSEMGVPISSGGKIRDYLVSVSKGLIQFVCIRSGRNVYRSLTAEKIQIHPGSVMFKEDPLFIVAGEIVRTSKMFAHSVSPLRKEWLNEISPGLSERFSNMTKSESTSVKKEDISDCVTIANETFKIEKRKGKKRKSIVIDFTKAKEIIASYAEKNKELFLPKGITATVLYKNMELLSGEKLSTVFRILPYIDENSLENIALAPRGSINIASSSGIDRIISKLHLIILPAKRKNKSIETSFISFNTDGQNNFWFKAIRSFDEALTISLASLEDLMDVIPEKETAGSEKINEVNTIYRKLTDILEAN